MPKPIYLQSLCLTFPHKTCFEDFTTLVSPGSRIGIIGQNGSGKSCLLKALLRKESPVSGKVSLPNNATIGYVPQVISGEESGSGAEKFQKSLTKALAQNPSILGLDEPTNHLDTKNRASLMNFLDRYQGTLFVVSHDEELLERCIEIIWHIESGKIHVFQGKYRDYISEHHLRSHSLEKQQLSLKKERAQTHQVRMKEQTRAKNSRLKGEKNIDQRKWPTVTSKAKANRAAVTAGKKKMEISQRAEEIQNQLSSLRAPEIRVPSFHLLMEGQSGKEIVSVQEGAASYTEDSLILEDIYFSLKMGERVALQGRNGSGKTTFVRALLKDEAIHRQGDWKVPAKVGYLNQQYGTLDEDQIAFEIIQNAAKEWSDRQIRDHLSRFLFQKTEEVETLVSSLSGGEKARLCLAQLSAQSPSFLILDEVTNNLDSQTRNHVIQVLQAYPGALLVISHDESFLKAIEVDIQYEINGRKLKLQS